MSLLEDIFLQDEAHEAEELERVIEGDELEDRRRSDSDDNSEKEDEAEEDKRRVDPAKAKATRVVKNPRFLLNPARLTGPRGIQVIPDHFKDFKFKGKGHEKEDLDIVLKRLEHWAYRLYPKFQFEDCLKKIEMLGKKKTVAVHLHKIRSDQFLSEDTVVQKDSSDEETAVPAPEEDEFDKLLQQQIELARSTPAPNSAKKHNGDSSIEARTSSLIMPKAISSPSISEDQRERMLRSRKLAEERRLARLKSVTNSSNVTTNGGLEKVNSEIGSPLHNTANEELNTGASDIHMNTDETERIRKHKHNRSNVIDSSDDETVVEANVSIAVDVHTDKTHNPEDISNEGIEKINQNVNKDQSNDHKEHIEENMINEKNDDNENITSKSYADVFNDASHAPKIETIGKNNSVKKDSYNDEMKMNNDVIVKGIINTENHETEESEKSGENEQLRYDDFDVNIELTESNSHFQDTENNKLIFEKAVDHVKEQDLRGRNDETPEKVLEEIMDVDFSENF